MLLLQSTEKFITIIRTLIKHIYIISIICVIRTETLDSGVPVHTGYSLAASAEGYILPKVSDMVICYSTMPGR